MSTPISFFVHCVPPAGTSQQKGVMVIGGKPRFFKKKAMRESENTWFELLRPHRPQMPLEGPVTLVIYLTYPWRKSEKKSRIAAYSLVPVETRPDVENVAKGMIDVMTTLGYFRDDSQISSLCLHKQYGDRPGFSVNLTCSLATTRGGQQATLA